MHGAQEPEHSICAVVLGSSRVGRVARTEHVMREAEVVIAPPTKLIILAMLQTREVRSVRAGALVVGLHKILGWVAGKLLDLSKLPPSISRAARR